ncbi:MAG: heparinase, partial [Actinobacteria bacterium]|nr:heparinase [Actinomycetota bacterium]
MAYKATGDEKYADLWARQFRRWVEQMPAPGIDEERGDSGWRGLEAGLRFSRIWPSAFFSVAPAKSVKDGDILLFLRSVVDH